MTQRAWIANLALSLGSVIVTLLVLEAGFRAFGIKGEYPAPRVDSVYVRPGAPTRRAPHAFIPHAVYRTRYASDPRGYFKPDVRRFLKRWMREGPTHHFALGVGHHAATIARIATILDIEYTIVTPHESIV